jgi:hypothetical protein
MNPTAYLLGGDLKVGTYNYMYNTALKEYRDESYPLFALKVVARYTRWYDV